MKKMVLIMAVVLAAGAVFGSMAFAAPTPAGAGGPGMCPYYSTDRTNWTDDQKQQMAAWQQQRLEQHKQMLAKQVEWGWITQAQADQRLAWMEQRQSAGAGMMGCWGGHGGCNPDAAGPGMHHGRGGR